MIINTSRPSHLRPLQPTALAPLNPQVCLRVETPNLKTYLSLLWPGGAHENIVSIDSTLYAHGTANGLNPIDFMDVIPIDLLSNIDFHSRTQSDLPTGATSVNVTKQNNNNNIVTLFHDGAGY